MKPTVSFVIPSHNCAAWLPHAVGSCLEQKYPNLEIIVVDDASTDSTGDYLEWIGSQDKPVKIIRLEKNVGRSEARNIGNKAASGQIICVLDADDIALPLRAKLTADAIERGAQFVYGSAVVMDSVGRAAGQFMADKFDKSKALETMENRIVHSTVGYTKDFAAQYQYLSGDVSRLGIDDWEQQTRAYMAGVKFDFIPNVISAYRILAGGVTNTRDPKEVKEFKTNYLEALKATA